MQPIWKRTSGIERLGNLNNIAPFPELNFNMNTDDDDDDDDDYYYYYYYYLLLSIFLMMIIIIDDDDYDY